MRARLRSTGSKQAGMTLVELAIASTLVVVVLLSIFAVMQRDGQLSQATLGIQIAETRAQQMVYSLQRELADARGFAPRASVSLALDGGASQVLVDSTRGFPDRGFLLIDRGTDIEERMAYTSLSSDETLFNGVERGVQCTTDTGHDEGVEVIWASAASPIELQNNPPASTFDGQAMVSGNSIFFRGDGSGFSYRVPTDPTGGRNFLDGDDLVWGATIGTTPHLSGWSALVFEPRFEVREADTNDDLNGDGDATDVFDIGQIRRRSWVFDDTSVTPTDVAIGPTMILQERCNWGGDLDGDGFDDPIFLWDPASRQLSVRIFIIGRSVVDAPIVRMVETVVFLRNEVAIEE